MQYIIFATSFSFFVALLVSPANVYPIIYECLDQSSHTVFTDSPVQLHECTDFNMGALSQKGRIIPSDTIKKPARRDDELNSSIKTTTIDHSNASSALSDILKPSASYPSRTFTVPITNMGGVAVVRAILNRKTEVNLLIDPGQPMTVFSFDLGKQLGLLPPTREKPKENDSLKNTRVPKVTQVGIIQIGPANAREVPVRIDYLPNEKPGISGLLGMSFFKKFRADLNLDRGYLRLQQLY